jgi:glutamine amidotransferase
MYGRDYVAPEDPAIIIGVTRYGDLDIPAIIGRDNIIATQFHPERSGTSGRKFAESIKRLFGFQN